MGIRLLGDRVMVKRAEAETTSGGIHLPESAREAPQRAEVLAVSEDAVIAPEIEEGDMVIVAKYGGTEIVIDGEEYLIVEADDVLAKEE